MATREIVELPDRKSGDINEIRDKKIALAKDATAQSDLPQQLEYLIKNGQTGEFMNVLDSYINEKIRSALGSLIASLDKGAAGTTKAIACIDTNNDLGIINPANLASVLGGTIRILTSSDNIYYCSPGLYLCRSYDAPSGIPSNDSGFLEIISDRSAYTLMRYTAITTNGFVQYDNAYWETAWRGWVQI